MQTELIAFRMVLKPGQGALYKARHDAIWPELVERLRQAGISEYSIFLHEPSNSLFATLRRTLDHDMDQLPQSAIMQLWWAQMAELMATDATGAPVVEVLPMMFHLS